jgi:hypothetical protein
MRRGQRAASRNRGLYASSPGLRPRSAEADVRGRGKRCPHSPYLEIIAPLVAFWNQAQRQWPPQLEGCGRDYDRDHAAPSGRSRRYDPTPTARDSETGELQQICRIGFFAAFCFSTAAVAEFRQNSRPVRQRTPCFAAGALAPPCLLQTISQGGDFRVLAALQALIR